MPETPITATITITAGIDELRDLAAMAYRLRSEATQAKGKFHSRALSKIVAKAVTSYQSMGDEINYQLDAAEVRARNAADSEADARN